MQFAILLHMELNVSWLTVALLVLAACGAACADEPKGLEKTILWRAGDAGYENYRIPGIVVTKQGTVLAYAVGRKRIADGDWSDSDILMRRSEDGGKSWGPSYRVAGTSRGVTDNPVAIVDARTGAVHLLYQTDYARCYYTRSVDDGRTFSTPVDITPVFDQFRSEFPWTVLAPSVGHAIQLRSGRLLAPVWLANGKETAPGRRAHAPSAVATVYSDDHGYTWRRGAIIARNSPEIANPSEAAAVELADGSVMINIRTDAPVHRRAVAFSPDGISNWTTPRFDEGLYDPICAAGLMRYGTMPADEHNCLLFSNPDSEAFSTGAPAAHGHRRNLTLRLSEDDGKTWPVKRVIEPRDAGYSDLAVGANKAIYCLYETPSLTSSKGNSVVVAQTTLAWLTGVRNRSILR